MTLCEYNADYQENRKTQQLKKLKPRDVVYEFKLLQYLTAREFSIHFFKTGIFIKNCITACLFLNSQS